MLYVNRRGAATSVFNECGLAAETALQPPASVIGKSMLPHDVVSPGYGFSKAPVSILGSSEAYLVIKHTIIMIMMIIIVMIMVTIAP